MADNFAQTVKQQADIVKIVGDYVKLRKTGAQNYTGLCPFHKEKTGSFSVNAAHGYFYCFGCHEKGDVFTFVMKLETISFPEAVRAVATKCGIALPKREFNSPEEVRDAGIRRQLIDLHEAATQYFEAALKSPEAARAREYLTGRGVNAETIAKFRIGYAPDDFNHMREAMRQHFNEEALRASGLFSAKEQADGSQGAMYARFRKRITFPIANEQGKTIAFTARALEDVDDKGRPVAKYMNSPETLLYTKGKVLFNLDKAKEEIRKNDFTILVEGQMDAISVYMAGIRNVVATSGTAFTESQASSLKKFSKKVLLNFDPDSAGRSASEKSLGVLHSAGFSALLNEEGINIRVLVLESGLDPDRFIREHGVKAYMDALRRAKPYTDHLIDVALQMNPGRTTDGKIKAMNFLLPHIREIQLPIRRSEFASNAAQKLGIDSGLLFQELKQAAQKRLESVPQHRQEPVSETERVLLRALVLPESDSARRLAAEQLAMHPEWFADLAMADVLEALSLGPAPENPLDAATTNEARAQMAMVLQHSPSEREQPLAVQVEDALHALERRRLERRQRELRTQIAEADRRGDSEMLEKLMLEKMGIDKRLREH